MAVITLDQAKLTLGITNSSKDELLQFYVDAATPVITYLGCDVDSTPYVETYDGGAPQIMLNHAPVLTVTSVVESYGSNYIRTLTPVDIFSGNPSDAYAYSIELPTGVITRRAAGVAVNFAPGNRNVKVSYTAGIADPPANVVLAALELVRAWWQVGQQGNRPGFGDAPEMAYATLPPDVQQRVRQLLSAQQRLPGLA